MLHVICAFKNEAQPLIEHYSLKHQGNSRLFNIYMNNDRSISLTISGLGKLAASAAVMYTYSSLQSETNDCWLNIGIAGHREKSIGELFLCDRVEDAGSGQVWYPQILVDNNLPGAPLVTLDQPSGKYSQSMFDMEASGIFHAASRVSTLEFIHSLKIISDNEQSPVEKIRKSAVSPLVADNIDAISGFVASLMQLSEQLPLKPDTFNEKKKFLASTHFTVQQETQLAALLHRWHVLFPGNSPSGILGSNLDASELLSELRRRMDSAPFYLDKAPRDD